MTTESNTGISRRQFLLLTGVTLATGPLTMAKQHNDGASGSVANRRERMVNAGPVSRYAVDGVYDGFCDQGFFVVRQGNRLIALSSYCTHRKCKLKTHPDHSFFCPCHGSTFDPRGKVVRGPARRDLPTLPSFTNETGELFVRVPNV